MTQLAIKKLEQMTVVPLGKIIQAEDYQRIVASEEALVAVEQEAEALYARRREQARQAGELEARQAAAEQMLNTAGAGVAYLSDLEQTLTSLAMEATRKIIGDLDATEALKGLISNALYKVRNESRITLRVSSARAPQVERQIEEISAGYPNIEFIDVVADKRIADDACRIEAASGSISTGIELQLDLLEQALRNNFRHDET